MHGQQNIKICITFEKIYVFSPTECIYVFYMTPITNRRCFPTQDWFLQLRTSVYCAVRTEYLTAIIVYHSL